MNALTAELPADPRATASGRVRSPIGVVVVDDHTLVREGACQLLDREPDIDVVGEAATGEDALVLLLRTRPDVAVIDINLPAMSGLQLARQVMSQLPDLAVLLVSAYDDYAYVAEALDLGVGGYLLKTASARELVDAVRAVADGVFVLDRAVSGRLARRWRHAPTGASAAGALTPREADVLRLVARGQSNKQVAAELGLGLRTVEGYVSTVLSKLGVVSRTEAALYAVTHHLVGAPEGRGPGPDGADDATDGA